MHDAAHKHARGMHRGGIDLSGLDEMLNLSDRDPAGGGALRVEVGGRRAVHQVAVPVALPGMYQREVGADPTLENVGEAVELAGLLGRRHHRNRARCVVAPRQAAVGDLSADPGRRVERRDAHAPGA